MILRLNNGTEHEIDKVSTANCFVIVCAGSPSGFELLAELTDENLMEYSLIEENKTTICKKGHFLTVKTYQQADGKWRTEYFIKNMAEQTDYKEMAEKLSEELAAAKAALDESDRALAILFGEEE